MSGGQKKIIMDKAPSGEQLTLKVDLGYDNNSFQILADALNAEFGTSITVAQLDACNTVADAIALAGG
ncbi:MAG: acyl carrier protein [Bacteroidia bacterium]|nr:acyl carrier protein [Bacteroidia bacterium]MCF8427476.1 acyl carrier protein [Bacteroidia bacterium]